MTDTVYVFGAELRVGDQVKVWWKADGQNFDTITKLVPYTGSLKNEFSRGARLASFLYNAGGMTIDNGADFEIKNRHDGDVTVTEDYQIFHANSMNTPVAVKDLLEDVQDFITESHIQDSRDCVPLTQFKVFKRTQTLEEIVV